MSDPNWQAVVPMLAYEDGAATLEGWRVRSVSWNKAAPSVPTVASPTQK
jgi:hypothetical protein